MRTVALEVETVQQPVQFLDADGNRLVRGIGRRFKRSGSRRLSQRQKPLRSQYKIFTRLRNL